jgi:NAD(P)-dependent dehydrogenase (short-subunit alcohol dehydrogenase family)
MKGNVDILDSFRMDERVVIVTGASRGIGHAIACGMVDAGARVFGIARSADPQSSVGRFDYSRCDVTDTAALENLVTHIFRQTGRIDVLVNAAGVTLPAEAELHPSKTFKKTLECNLTAIFEFCRIAVPYMIQGGYGSVINVTSIGASFGFPGNPGYAAAKGGLAALTRALALDYGPQGIRVNNLVPGYIETAMTSGSFSNPQHRAARAARTMLGRWGQPEELAGAAVFLASEASRYVTGSDLVVDGGWMAKGL